MAVLLLLIVLLLIVLVVIGRSVRVAQEYQRAVVFNLGRITGMRGPGLYLLVPFAERSVTVDMRVVTSQLDTQETVTREASR